MAKEMSRELQARVAFHFVSVLGFVKLTSPSVYRELFDIDEEFSRDEIQTILDLSTESETYKISVSLAKEMLDNEEKEDIDG